MTEEKFKYKLDNLIAIKEDLQDDLSSLDYKFEMFTIAAKVHNAKKQDLENLEKTINAINKLYETINEIQNDIYDLIHYQYYERR